MLDYKKRDRMAVRENPKGNKEIQESREMSEVVFMNPISLAAAGRLTQKESGNEEWL